MVFCTASLQRGSVPDNQGVNHHFVSPLQKGNSARPFFAYVHDAAECGYYNRDMYKMRAVMHTRYALGMRLEINECDAKYKAQALQVLSTP